ncbi:MAG: tetratricopeptide (TPR) repeat protein, partial [Planctomycetota bacterium]
MRMALLRSKWAPLSLVVVFLVLAYWRVTQCGFIWDDDDYVWQNPVLRSWGGLGQIWFEPTSLPQYYPLVHTSFWLEAHLFGLPPFGTTMEKANEWATGYHLVNVVLHGMSAMVLLRLGRRMAVPGILFAALWFLVHPVHVESVAWVTERKNVLSLLCYLLAAERWLRWHDGPHRFDSDGSRKEATRERSGDTRRRDYVIGSLWLLGALWSKTVTASLPAALLIIIWWRDGKITKRAFMGALPWFVVGASLGWFTVYLEATHVGAADAPWQLQGMQRIAVAGGACWFYFGSLLWPFDTCFNYPRWDVNPPSILLWAAPVAALLAVVGAWLMRARIGRGATAALLLFGGTLVPAIGFFDVYPFRYSFVADHFQYHASLGLIVAFSAVLARLLQQRAGETVAVAVGGVWLVVMSFTTQAALHEYRDFKTLWTITLEKNPNSMLSLANLGGLATDARDLAAARDYLTRALAIDDTGNEANVNLGIIEQLSGNPEAAKKYYLRGLALKPNDPNVRNNLAVLAIEATDYLEAIRLTREALVIDPSYYTAHATLGWALTETKQWQAAMPELEWVLQRTPDVLETRRRAVRCLLGLKQPGPAAGNALLAVKNYPGDAEARALCASALAVAFQNELPTGLRAKLTGVIQKGGVNPTPMLPL